jgi:hypothetical protein
MLCVNLLSDEPRLRCCFSSVSASREPETEMDVVLVHLGKYSVANALQHDMFMAQSHQGYP